MRSDIVDFAALARGPQIIGKRRQDAEPLGVAVVGYGYWGPNLVRNVIERPEFEMRTLCEMSSARASAFTQKYPGIDVQANEVVSATRQQAGDISEVDLGRLELQRVQYESDLQNAEVSLRTAKIQLLSLLNERTPIEQFDVSGKFDFSEQPMPLEEFRAAALDARPDLRAALQAVSKSQTDHRLAIANGSADPTFGVDFGRNPPVPAYFGVSVTIPVRVFDRNQGEKMRTELDVTRNQALVTAGRAQVFSDVDSAYATIAGNIALLRPYKDKYLAQAAKVRDTVSFAYQNGGASLLDFLSAQNDYRNIQLSYLNLVGSYMIAAGQMNLAVGREVIP